MHLDEEQVQRFLHGELAPAAETSVREHVGACPPCRERVAEARREEDEVYARLRHVDHPAPRIRAGTVAATARAHRVGRWAAGILLALGAAGAAYAAPGSPLPAWLDTVATRLAGVPPASVPASAPAAEPSTAGIAVVPGAEFVIDFSSAQAEGEVIVSLIDGDEVEVRALGGAASFTSEPERLIVGNEGSSATFQVHLPRDAQRVEIRVGGAPVFLKEGARITTEAPRNERGTYRLPLSRGGS